MMIVEAIIKWCVANWKLFVYLATALVAVWLWHTVSEWRQTAALVPELRQEVLQEKKKREEEVAECLIVRYRRAIHER